MALVGSYVGLSRLLVAVIPVFLLAWLRFGIAAVAMAGWVRRAPSEAPLSPRERRLLFWESFLGNFGFSICMLFGVAATSAVAAGVVMAAIPAVVAVMSWAFLGERITPRVRGAIVLAGAGIATLALAKMPSGPDTVSAPWWGYALLLGAVFCEASYVVIGKRLAASVDDPSQAQGIEQLGSALECVPGILGRPRDHFRGISNTGIDRLLRGIRRSSRHGQDGALDRAGYCGVGEICAPAQQPGDSGTVDGVILRKVDQDVAGALEDLGQDHPRVATSTQKRTPGHGGSRGGSRSGICHGSIDGGAGGLHGQVDVRARVAVRHGEHIEAVNPGPGVLETVQCGIRPLLDSRAVEIAPRRHNAPPRRLPEAVTTETVPSIWAPHEDSASLKRCP